MNILLICTGNTCRSPMAEALLRDKLPQANVQSAGVFSVNSQPINEHARDALNQKGITFLHHSQPVTEKLLDWAHLVLAMTTEHICSLILQYPDFQEKYFTLKEFVINADKIVWDELKEMYVSDEERSLFVQKGEYRPKDHAMSGKRHDNNEDNLSDYNISDPFGGNLEVYKRTLAELDKYINLLINKIK